MKGLGGIRGRLWLGIGGLIMVLLLTAGLALWIGLRANLEIEQTFKDNGDSIAYMHELTDAASQVDAWVRTQMQAARPEPPEAVSGLLARADADLQGELRNVTEKGEREAALDLKAAWSDYAAGLSRVLRPGLDARRRRSLYNADLAPAYARTQELAWVIADLNLRNARFRDHGRELLASEFRFMVALLLLGIGMGVALAVRLSRSLVDPLLADVTALRRLDEMKNGLLAAVSHEIKNPLTSLRMAAHLLEEDEAAGRTGRKAALLASLKENVERMHGAMQDLLELDRLESGDLLRLESTRPESLLREVLEPLRPGLENQGRVLELVLEDSLPPVAADAGRLKLVFSNLLDNAARHSPPGSKLTVGAAREAGGARFWVQDEGPGVHQDYEGRIFERFFRAPGQPEGTGLGLGLAIASEIVELHGGRLRLDPSERGARFSFFLPSAAPTLLSASA